MGRGHDAAAGRRRRLDALRPRTGPEPLSEDDVLKWPYLIQWTAKPYYDGKFDIVVAAGGRLFRANATLAVDNTKRPTGSPPAAPITDSVLWKRKTADDFGTFGSLIVATPEVVYVKDGNGVLPRCRDGRGVERFSLSDDPQSECRWLMLQDGVLVTVLGPRPQVKSLASPEALTISGKAETKDTAMSHHFAIQQHWFQDYDQGTELVAIDAASGKELWRLAGRPDRSRQDGDRGRPRLLLCRSLLCILPGFEDGQNDLEDRCRPSRRSRWARDGASPS